MGPGVVEPLEYSWASVAKGKLEDGGNASKYIFSKVLVSDSGQYSCQATSGEEIIQSDTFQLKVTTRPRAVLTLESEWTEMFTTERVTLRCEVQGSSTEWIYKWYRDGQELLPVDKADSSSRDGDRYIILSAALSHNGEYTCRGQHTRKSVYSTDSHPVTLKVLALPQPVLTLESGWTEIFTTERVTLKCEIQGSSTEWIYKWYRDGQELPVDKTDSSSRDGDRYKILNAALSHSGQYTCRGQHKRKYIYTSDSHPVTLSVSARPRAVLTLESEWTEMFTTERVTLRCEVQGSSTEWIYKWYRDGQELPVDKADSSSRDGDRYTILSAALSHNGEYTCRGQHTRKSVYSADSHPVTLKVLARPRAVLTLESEWTEMFTTERVTLRCEVQGSSTEWIYKWYRDGQELPVDKADSSSRDGDRYTILSAALSHNGEYTCRGQHTRKSVYSTDSHPVTLKVLARPRAVLTLESEWTEMFTTERVTLRCEVQGSSTEWIYKWYRDGQELPVDKADSSSRDGDRYTILSAALSHNGEYTCRGQHTRKSVYSTDSHPVTLKVLARPQAVLTLESEWTEMFTTERVTLRCEIQGSSTEWIYKWYRDGQELPVDKADPSSRDGEKYKILFAAPSDSGQYTCRGQHKRKYIYTRDSHPVTLKVSATSPKPLLTLDPPSAEIYTGDRVTLSCGLGGDSAGWEYLWYRDTQGTALPNTDSSRTDGSSYTISQTAVSHSGQYWCRATRGRVSFHSQYSDALTLDILARPQAVLTLQSGWTEMFTTENVTLRCEVRGSDIEWNYTWYRDGQEISQDSTKVSSGTRERYEFNSAVESQKTEFSCRGERTTKPTYSLKSDILVPRDIIRRRKIVIGISGPVILVLSLIILVLIFLRICRKPEPKRKPQDDLFFTRAEMKIKDPDLHDQLNKGTDSPTETKSSPQTSEEAELQSIINSNQVAGENIEENMQMLSSFTGS
ncbi:Fc receptor-like protein 5 [Amia ocellicauda]|uniref:Fc receptor-like protein 5 n=1 Tax=Amia ocellicauda TaxID=2972642 RepID=UPI0034639866